MTRFIHIDPAKRTVTLVEADDPHAAIPKLSVLNVDHGVVAKGVGILVYEYGLLEGDGPYFVLNGQLYSGDAVLYGYDEIGETVDIVYKPQPIWLADKFEVEMAIMAGVVQRPVAKVNGVPVWSWS